MKKAKTMTALLLAIVFVLSSCSPAGGTDAETSKAEEKITETAENEAQSDAEETEKKEESEEVQPQDTMPEEEGGEISFEETDEGIILDAFITGDMEPLDIEEPTAGEGETEEVNEEELNRARSTLLYNHAALFYYYSTLNKSQKKIYRRLLNVLRYPDSTERGKTFKLKAAPGSKKFNKMYWKASTALLYDHPELFWYFRGSNNVGIQYYYTRYPDENGRYTFQFQLTGTYANYRKEVTAFYNEVDSIMKGLDKNAPKCRLALQIHDKLIDLCSYNYDVADNNKDNDYGHTAYGALVKDSSGRWNKPVCDGYSLAYEFILQQLGFYVTVIVGDAGGSRSTAGCHAWNAVYLNGNWYEVDVTWDDVETDRWRQWEIGRIAANDSSFVWKVRHYLFLVPTDYISNFTDGPSYTYRLRNGAWFQVVGNSVHIRYGKSKTHPFGEAPYCKGGKYFHGQNI